MRCTSDNKQIASPVLLLAASYLWERKAAPKWNIWRNHKRHFQYWALQMPHYWLLINLFVSAFVDYKFELKIGFASPHKTKLHSNVHCCLLIMWILSTLHSSASQLFKVIEPRIWAPDDKKVYSCPNAMKLEQQRFHWKPALYKSQAKLLCCPRYLKGGKISNKFWLKLLSLSD